MSLPRIADKDMEKQKEIENYEDFRLQSGQQLNNYYEFNLPDYRKYCYCDANECNCIFHFD